MKINFKTAQLVTYSFASGFFVCWLVLDSSMQSGKSLSPRVTKPTIDFIEISAASFSEIHSFSETPTARIEGLDRKTIDDIWHSVDLIDNRPQPLIHLDLDK
jgi:hypothetical protein